MPFTHTVSQAIDAGAGAISKSKQYTGSGRVSINETIANAVTDGPINVAIDVSAVKSFLLVSDKDVLIQTNDGTTPDDEISLLAGVPYIWTVDSYDAFLLTVDVTEILVTNASGDTATIQLEALVDATP
jgi:hypothetical protein